MSERQGIIENAVKEMLAEGRDLIASGLPELPVLKDKAGLDDITQAERKAAYDAVHAPPPENAGGGADEDGAEEAPEALDIELSTFLYHKTERARLVHSHDEYREARGDGFFDLADLKDKKAALAIHERERNPGTLPPN